MSTPRSRSQHAARQPGKYSPHKVTTLFLIGVGLVFLGASVAIATTDGIRSLVTDLFIVAGGLVTIVGATFIKRGNQLGGSHLLLVALAAVFSSLIMRYEGVGIVAAISFTVISAALITQTYPKDSIARGLILAIAASIGLLLLEYYQFGSRRVEAPLPQGVVYAVAGANLLLIVLTASRIRHYDLRTKLIGAFLIVALVPVMIQGFITSRATLRALTHDANQRLLAAARQTAVSLDDFFNHGLATIRTEAQILEESGYFELPEARRTGSVIESNVLALLRTFRDKDPLILSSYAILDLEGRVTLEFPPGTGNSEADLNHFTVPMRTGWPYMSPVEFSPETGEPFLSFSSPLRDRGNQVVGILRARYKAAVLQELIARSTGLVGGQTFAVLFDENYLHLAHGTAREAIFKLAAPIDAERQEALKAAYRLPDVPMDALSMGHPELVAKLDTANNEPFFAAEDEATGTRINQVGVTTMRTQPWLVAFFQPQDVYLVPIESLARQTIILAVAIMAAVVVAATGLAQLLSGPITRLEMVTARVAEGELGVRAKVESNDEIGSLARAFNVMTGRLQDALTSSERRVADRTRALAVSAEISRRLSTILEEQRLVSEVVTQVQSAFDYYHAHIYLIDQAGDRLLMAGGTGRAGRKLLAAGHRIPVGRGLVGQAAEANQVVLVPDVSKDPSWLPNPLLPETKCEIAVPIALGEQVLGVLDVQHNVTGGLQHKDVTLLQTIASQTAIALQNARSYEMARRQADREALVNTISRRILSTKDMQSAMKVAIRDLGRMLEAEQVTLRFRVGQDSGQRPLSSDSQESLKRNG